MFYAAINLAVSRFVTTELAVRTDKSPTLS